MMLLVVSVTFRFRRSHCEHMKMLNEPSRLSAKLRYGSGLSLLFSKERRAKECEL